MQKFGRYVVLTGAEAGINPTSAFYRFYIVTDDCGEVKGYYDTELMASNLAKGLDRAERKLIDETMEKVILGGKD